MKTRLGRGTSAWVALVALVLAALVTTPTTAQAAATRTVGIVVGNAASPTVGDQRIGEALSSGNFAPTFVDDNALATTDFGGFDAMFITSSVNAGTVGSTLRDVAVPVVVSEPYVFDDLGMTENRSTKRGEQGTQTVVRVVDESHPIVAGLAGDVVVATKATGFTWGVPADSAAVIGVLRASAARATVFAYETGDELVGGIAAPAPRIGLFLSTTTGKFLTPAGESIIVAAIEHGLGGSGPSVPGNEAPTVDAGPDQDVSLGDPISVSAAVSDDGMPGDPGVVTIAWSGPDGVAFADPASATTTVTVPGAGTFELTVSASDGDATSSDSLALTVIDPDAPPVFDIAFIANSAKPALRERAAVDHLVSLGHTVTTFDDNRITPARALDFDVVYVAGSAVASTFESAWKQVAVPVVVSSGVALNRFGLVPNGSSQGRKTGEFEIAVSSVSHPITAGFEGAVRVSEINRQMNWGKPTGDVDILASLTRQPARKNLFAYDRDAVMSNGKAAPARRVAFFAGVDMPVQFSDAGRELLVRAITWAGNDGRPNPAPIAVATADPTSGVAPLVVRLDASESTDDSNDIVAHEWDFGDGSTGSGATTTTVYRTAGIFTATVTVTDIAGGTSTATVDIEVAEPPEGEASDAIAAYDFADGTGSTVSDVAAVGAPLDLTIQHVGRTSWLPGGGLRIEGDTVVSSGGPADKVLGAIVGRGEMTAEAWIVPANLNQSGPARITALSNGPANDDNANFMLGQGVRNEMSQRVEARFRTSHTTADGQPGVISRGSVLDGSLAHVVFTRTTTGAERMYVNGVLVGAQQVGGDLGDWDFSTPLLIGNEPSLTRTFRGDFHWIAYYDRALSQPQVCDRLLVGPPRALPGHDLPVPCAVVTGDQVTAPADVHFDGSHSGDRNGAIVLHEWDFGDGATATGESATHRYVAHGTYSITHTVTDDNGNKASDVHDVVLLDPNPPVPTFEDTLGMRNGNGLFKLQAYRDAQDWLGAPINYTTQFTDHRTVEAMGSSSNGLFASDTAKLPLVVDELGVSLTVGLAFGSADLKKGGVEAVAENLQATVDGEYDFHYYRTAQRMVEAGFGDSIVRLGHEFNGRWPPWASQGNEELFIEAYRHVHDLFSAVSPDFRFDWSGLRNGWADNAPPAYPGDDYVDIVGLSIYWKGDTPSTSTWDLGIWNSRFKSVMIAQRDFAIAHGKQISYPEWGIFHVDEAAFIDEMHSWLSGLPVTGPGSLAYHVYWDSGADGERLQDMPAVAARYKQRFGS